MDLKIYLKKSAFVQKTEVFTREQVLNTLVNPANTLPEAQKQALQHGHVLGYTQIASDSVSRSITALEALLAFIVENYELDDILNILEEQIDAEIKLCKKE